jgi:hypothetical protein
MFGGEPVITRAIGNEYRRPQSKPFNVWQFGNYP